MKILFLFILILVSGCADHLRSSNDQGTPISIELSILPEDEIMKEGEVFKVVIHNISNAPVRLDKRCIWPSSAVKASLTSGERLSAVLPPAPTSLFKEYFIFSIEPKNAYTLRIGASEFLNNYSFKPTPFMKNGLTPLNKVNIVFTYSPDNLRDIGVYLEDYPMDKNVWLGITSSNVLEMTISRLNELYIMDMKAKGLGPEDSLRYW